MKRFLQATLATALLAGTAVSAMAQRPVDPNEKNPNREGEGWSEFFVKDFAIQKGEVKEIEIYLNNPNYQFTAAQFDIYTTGGLKIYEDEDGVWLDPTERVPGVLGLNATSRNYSYVAQGAWQSDGAYRHLFYNSKGLYVDGTSGPLFTLYVTTDETFGTTSEPATIYFGTVKISDIGDTEHGHRCRDMVSDAYEAVTVADFLNTKDALTRFVADPVKVVAKAPEKVDGRNLVFVTDGNDNWLKLALNDEDNAKFEVGQTYEGGQLGGSRYDNVNPSVAVDKTFGNELASTAITAGIEKIDMSHSFTLASNQVVSVTGYFFNDDNQETLRAYSGNSGVRGQSLTINNGWVSGNVMENGKPYTISKAAVQLKAAWETPSGAPALIAPSDENSFQNYVIYPLDAADVATGVTELNAKTISNVRYVNVAGVESATPFQGVNLVVTTYTDGTTSTVKVVK